jgi:hypothetical protein
MILPIGLVELHFDLCVDDQMVRERMENGKDHGDLLNTMLKGRDLRRAGV